MKLFSKIISLIGLLAVPVFFTWYQLDQNFTQVLPWLSQWLPFWPILLCGIIFAMGRELMEHSRDNRWDKPNSNWWNSNKGWKNKHEWQPSWLFKTALVWLTDAEHFFQMVSTLGAFAAVWLAASIGYVAPFAAAIVFYLGNAVFGIIKETLLPNVQ